MASFLILYQDYTTKTVKAETESEAAVKGKTVWKPPKAGEKLILSINKI